MKLKKQGKFKIAVHKFTSCDGCQLAFLNLGENLLTLVDLVELVHFAEAGPINNDANVDIAFVEGSVSTPIEIERIKQVREQSNVLITIGACATSGGIQALRNFADHKKWVADIYADPSYINSLETSTAIANYVSVDYELWGCPVTSKQIIMLIRSLLFNVTPNIDRDVLCLECKRQQNVCVLVAKGETCMGPVTKTGCGAICPSVGRACYACFGPCENPNTEALTCRFSGLGLLPEEISRKFLHINNQAQPFKDRGAQLLKQTGKIQNDQKND